MVDLMMDHCSAALGRPPQPMGFCCECDRCLSPSIARILPSCNHRFCDSCLQQQIPCGSLTVACPVCQNLCIVPIQGLQAFAPQPSESSNRPYSNQYRPSSQSTLIDSLRRRMAAAAAAVLNSEHGEDSGVETNANLSVHIDNNSSQADTNTCSPHNITASSSNVSSNADGWWQCQSHPGYSLRLYCVQCELPLCDECAESSYEHSSHVVVVLRDALNKHTHVLHDLLNKLRHKLSDCRLKRVQLGPSSSSDEESAHMEMAANDPVRSSLHDCFDRLIEALRERRAELSLKLTDQRKKRKDLLHQERIFWSKRIREITKECEKADNILKEREQLSTPIDSTTSLFTFKEMARRLNDLLEEDVDLDSGVDQTVEPNDAVLFYPAYLPALEELVDKLGVVASRSQLNAEATARGEGLRYCCVCVPTTVFLTVRAKFGGKIVHMDVGYIHGEICMKQTGLKQTLTVTEKKDHTYQMTYTLPEEGTYSLHICIFDKPIRGSPFTVKCVNERRYSTENCSIHSKSKSKSSRTTSSKTGPPVEDDLLLKVGCKGRSGGQFCNPQGICCLSDGRIAVADSNLNCVQLFSDQGICNVKFGVRGREAGMITRPIGLIQLSNGNLAVSDYESKYISIFNVDEGKENRYVARFAGERLLGPKGLDIDLESKKLFVIDNKASAVLIYDEITQKLIRSFGTRGSKPHQLAGPHFVAYNKHNKLLYVTDFHHHCVKAFDLNGEYVMSFGCNGVGNGQFNAPTGIAIDENDNILVADWGNNRIQVFDSNGSFVSFVNGDADPLYGPQGLAVTVDGYCAVSDSGNHCYKIYRYLQ